MAELGIAFNAETPRELLLVYFKNLSDLSLYQVENGIRDIIKSGNRFPSVSEIRSVAKSYRQFRTVEKPVAMIEEFSSVNYTPQNADDFFAKVLAGFP